MRNEGGEEEEREKSEGGKEEELEKCEGGEEDPWSPLGDAFTSLHEQRSS